MVGVVAIVYSLWHLIFQLDPKLTLATRKAYTDRRRIYIIDPKVDEDRSEMIALLEKNIEDNDLS